MSWSMALITAQDWSGDPVKPHLPASGVRHNRLPEALLNPQLPQLSLYTIMIHYVPVLLSHCHSSPPKKLVPCKGQWRVGRFCKWILQVGCLSKPHPKRNLSPLTKFQSWLLAELALDVGREGATFVAVCYPTISPIGMNLIPFNHFIPLMV